MPSSLILLLFFFLSLSFHFDLHLPLSLSEDRTHLLPLPLLSFRSTSLFPSLHVRSTPPPLSLLHYFLESLSV
ncbi:hypothetical protein MtrunA17_Chr7g0262861 [Medicago truncatula]|uniref:Transmembrane protein n=1 Tax=Medicago truncatula TaxID=3880 RepID=A0A396H4Y5_MEDTR|nr:hypothetical protein MtrunA17_Chr7g0262861 [Medicago truncatula]